MDGVILRLRVYQATIAVASCTVTDADDVDPRLSGRSGRNLFFWSLLLSHLALTTPYTPSTFLSSLTELLQSYSMASSSDINPSPYRRMKVFAASCGEGN